MNEELFEILQNEIAALRSSLEASFSSRLSNVASQISGVGSSVDSLRNDVRNIQEGLSRESREGSSRRSGREPKIPTASAPVQGSGVIQMRDSGAPLDPVNVTSRVPSSGDLPDEGYLGGRRGSMEVEAQESPIYDLLRKKAEDFNPEEIVSELFSSFDTQDFSRNIAAIRQFAHATRMSPEAMERIRSISGSAIPEAKEMYSSLREQIGEAGEVGDFESVEEYQIQIDQIQELIGALESAKDSYEDGSDKIENTMGETIASIASALMLNQYAMMRFVSQPYQYETQPALQTMGNMGMMGELLAEGYGAQEAVLQEYRGFGVQAGGSLGGALGFMAGGIGGGVAGGLAGTAVGILGQDIIADSLAGGMDERARSAAIGRRILDPQRFTEEFFRPTMQARIGYDMGPGSISDELSSLTVDEEGEDTGVTALGYNNVVIGQILGQALSTLAPGILPDTEREREEFISTTGGLEAFGMSRDQIFGLYSDISRYGSQDYERSIATLLSSTSDDGDITEYTANVLVPALSKVVESRTIQNIAKSSELVERETSALYSYFKNGENNLATMLEANPEVMSNIFNMVSQIGDTAVNDPALMLYLQGQGLSMEEIITGDPRTLIAPLEQFSGEADYDASGEMDLGSARSFSSIVGFLSATGMDVNTRSVNIVKELMETVNQGGEINYDEVMEDLEQTSPEAIMAQLSERLDELMGTDGGEATAGLVESANQFYALMEENTDTMSEINDSILDLFSNASVVQEMISSARDRLQEEINNLLGRPNVDDKAIFDEPSMQTYAENQALQSYYRSEARSFENSPEERANFGELAEEARRSRNSAENELLDAGYNRSDIQRVERFLSPDIDVPGLVEEEGRSESNSSGLSFSEPNQPEVGIPPGEPDESSPSYTPSSPSAPTQTEDAPENGESLVVPDRNGSGLSFVTTNQTDVDIPSNENNDSSGTGDSRSGNIFSNAAQAIIQPFTNITDPLTNLFGAEEEEDNRGEESLVDLVTPYTDSERDLYGMSTSMFRRRQVDEGRTGDIIYSSVVPPTEKMDLTPQDFREKYENEVLPNFSLLNLRDIKNDFGSELSEDEMVYYRARVDDNIRLRAGFAMQDMSEEEKESFLSGDLLPALQDTLGFENQDQALLYLTRGISDFSNYEMDEENENSGSSSSSSEENASGNIANELFTVETFGETIRLVMEFENTSPGEIQQIAESSARKVLNNERII